MPGARGHPAIEKPRMIFARRHAPDGIDAWASARRRTDADTGTEVACRVS